MVVEKVANRGISRKSRKMKNDNLMVAVRVRPMSNVEVSLRCTKVATVLQGNMVCLQDPFNDEDHTRANRSRGKSYVFDCAFGPESTQLDVYRNTTENLIDSVLQGYNATIFAYGPTGAGKTFTMLGTEAEPGIMVLTLNGLYTQLDRTSDDQKYTVKLSYLELYNEMIRDLLNPSLNYLDLREDSKGVQVSGLSEYEALTTSQVMEMLSRGNKQRMCEPTAINKTSSRSHAVLQVTVTQKSRLRGLHGDVKTGKLFMIDLAGSERAAKTQNTGKRLIEGAHINRSLLALGNCINALTEKEGKRSYVNYRDSKLTRLLKDSLGGKCKTVMIAHVSPASADFEETRNTLTYANRAKGIKVNAKQNAYNVNYHVTQYQSIISELREEVIRLKTQMVSNEHRKSSGPNTHRLQSAQIKEKLKEELKLCFQEQLDLRKEIIELENSCMKHYVEYQRQLLIIDEWENQQVRRHIREKKPKNPTHHHHHATYATAFNRYNRQPRLEEPADVTIAREELENIKRYQKELKVQKTALIERLEEQKKEKSFLEDSCARKITNEEHKEIITTLCKVHECQIKNIELESLALMREYLIEQKDLSKQRDLMRQKMVQEIIDLQRNLIQENQIRYPVDLDDLYSVYLQALAKDNRDVGTTLVSKPSQVPSLPTLVQPQDMTSARSSMEGSTISTRSQRRNAKKPWLPEIEMCSLDARRGNSTVYIPTTYRIKNKKLLSLHKHANSMERRETFVMSRDTFSDELPHKPNCSEDAESSVTSYGVARRRLHGPPERKRSASADFGVRKIPPLKGEHSYNAKGNNTEKDVRMEVFAPVRTIYTQKHSDNNFRTRPLETSLYETRNKHKASLYKPKLHRDNLSVNGTTFAPKHVLPGFARL